MDYSFGRADIQDMAELIRLRVGYLTDDFGSLSPEDEALLTQELPPYFESHLNRDLLVFVARSEGVIVSCAWLLFVEKPPSPRFPHGKTGTLFNVYTAPGHRRRGLASRVMEVLIKSARDLAFDVIELNATDDGYPLYRSLGFEDDSSTHVAMRMML